MAGVMEDKFHEIRLRLTKHLRRGETLADRFGVASSSLIFFFYNPKYIRFFFVLDIIVQTIQ